MVTLLVPFLLLFWLLSCRGFPRREAFLLASTAWAVYLVIVTELLSLPGYLTAGPLRLAWWSASAAILIVLWITRREQGLTVPRERIQWQPALILLIPLGMILAALAVVALISPPNNFDSMTYHMARVAHWAYNHDVRHYPSHNLRQLHMNPGAEFILLHLQILNGGDRFANLVQWFALVGSLVGVSLIAARLGASVRGQVFSAVFCGTIPMAVLQACTTQNDLVAGFWYVALACFVLLAADEQDSARRRVWIAAVGGALGVAILTKGTMYCFAPPMIAWFAVSLFRRIRWNVVLPILFVVAATLGLNAGHYVRNYSLFGSPLGPGKEFEDGRYKYANDVFGPRVLASNVIRNVALELGVPSKKACDVLLSGVKKLHGVMNMDPNDPRTTMTDNVCVVPGTRWDNEDFAPNPLHVLLIAVALAMLPFVRWPDRSRPLVLAVVVVAGFLLFCGLLRYQYWANRLHLPLILLAGPLVGLVLDRSLGRWTPHVLLWALLVPAIPVMLMNRQHPWFGSESIFSQPREVQYFRNNPVLKGTYGQIRTIARDRLFSRIGVVMSWNIPEYPLWVLLQMDNPKACVGHVMVKNVSARLPGGSGPDAFRPDAVFRLVDESMSPLP